MEKTEMEMEIENLIKKGCPKLSNREGDFKIIENKTLELFWSLPRITRIRFKPRVIAAALVYICSHWGSIPRIGRDFKEAFNVSKGAIYQTYPILLQKLQLDLSTTCFHCNTKFEDWGQKIRHELNRGTEGCKT